MIWLIIGIVVLLIILVITYVTSERNLVSVLQKSANANGYNEECHKQAIEICETALKTPGLVRFDVSGNDMFIRELRDRLSTSNWKDDGEIINKMIKEYNDN